MTNTPENSPTVWDTIDPIRKEPTTYIIKLLGCDDYTAIPYLVLGGELPALLTLARQLNEEGGGCKSTMSISTAEPAEEDDYDALTDAAGNRWVGGVRIA